MANHRINFKFKGASSSLRSSKDEKLLRLPSESCLSESSSDDTMSKLSNAPKREEYKIKIEELSQNNSVATEDAESKQFWYFFYKKESYKFVSILYSILN